jgi:hypothetical protein
MQGLAAGQLAAKVLVSPRIDGADLDAASGS